MALYRAAACLSSICGWFKIQTTSGEEMALYCERQAKNVKKPESRDSLYTICT